MDTQELIDRLGMAADERFRADNGTTTAYSDRRSIAITTHPANWFEGKQIEVEIFPTGRFSYQLRLIDENGNWSDYRGGIVDDVAKLKREIAWFFAHEF